MACGGRGADVLNAAASVCTLVLVAAAAGCGGSPDDSAGRIPPAAVPDARSPVGTLLVERMDSASRDGMSWRVVDSVLVGPWNPMDDPSYAFAVEVRVGARVDTLERLIDFESVNSTGALFIAIGVQGDELETARQVVLADAVRSRRIDVPDDVYYNFHDLAVSPDGRYLAYVASGTIASISDLFSGERVFQSAPAQKCDCDIDFSHARWITADSAEFALDDQNASEPGWRIIGVHLRPLRATVSSSKTEPDFHGQSR